VGDDREVADVVDRCVGHAQLSVVGRQGSEGFVGAPTWWWVR